MIIFIISIVIILIFLIGFFGGAVAYRTPEEKEFEDEEQIEFLRKWREERDNRQSVFSKGENNE